MKKYALVLSGGGFKGAFQIGALRHLKEHWSQVNPDNPVMKFDVVAGVSVGSLNGVLTACDEFEALEKLWFDIGSDVEEIYTSDFIDTKNQTDELVVDFNFKKIAKRFIPHIDPKLSWWDGIRLLLSSRKRKRFVDELLVKVEKDFSANFRHFKAIADNTPLQKKLKALVRKDKIKNTVYKCGFVSLNDGNYYSFSQAAFKTDDDFTNGILASTSMPVVWTPVDKITIVADGKDYTIDQSVDGGIRNVSPLADVIDEINKDDPEHDYTIVIINCNSGEVEYERYEDSNIAGIALRSLNDIAITEIFNNDISEFLRINDIIGQVRSVNPALEIRNYNLRQGRTAKVLRPFKAIIIQTDPGILGNSLVANKSLNERRMEHGRVKSAAALEKIANPDGGDPGLVIV